MTRQDKIDNRRDKIDSRGKLTVEKDIKMFFKMLKNKLNLIKFQSKKLASLQKQMGRLLPWADKISARAAKRLKEDQDKSFQLIQDVLDTCVEECATKKTSIDDFNMTFDEFLSRFEGNVNEENFGS